MTVAGSSRAGAAKKPAANKKLVYVLGAVFVLAVVLKLMPGVIGGGSTHLAPIGTSTFHYHKTPQGVAKPGGTGNVAASTRDPFAPPPGYEATH